MQLDEPLHGLWCTARLKKAVCGSCGKSVLFFYCDCDCRVLVEGSGSAWRVHACRPGLNRFSLLDAFRIGQLLNRRVAVVELSEGRLGDLSVTFDGAEWPLPDAWVGGQIAACRASFEVTSNQETGEGEAGTP